MQFSDLNFATTGFDVPEIFSDLGSLPPFTDDDERCPQGGVCVAGGATIHHWLKPTRYQSSTRAFLTVLREHRSVIDGAALFDGLKRQVVLGSEQTPQYSDIRNAEHDGGEFFLVRRVAIKKQQSAPETADPLEALEKRCSALGFKKGTEKHGDCVMKLFK